MLKPRGREFLGMWMTEAHNVSCCCKTLSQDPEAIIKDSRILDVNYRPHYPLSKLRRILYSGPAQREAGGIELRTLK